MTLLALPLAAQGSQPKEGLRQIKYPVAVDGFCSLSPSVMADKLDYRENLGMYGIRPAFVFILPEDSTDDKGNINLAAYKEMLTFIDDVGKRMAKKADVIACYYLERGADPAKPPAHVTQAKLKNASLMAMELWGSKFITGDVLDLKFNMDMNSELGAMNWLYMSGPAEIGDSGMGAKDPKLEDNLKRVEKRTPLKSGQASAMESLAKWNIGEAMKKIAAAEKANKDEDAAWTKAYREIAEKMEEKYRDLVIKPEEERKYFIEQGEGLATLAKMLKGDEREKAVTEELNDLKKTDEYKLSMKARPKFLELQKEFYSISVPRSFRESMQQYYKKRADAFQSIKGKLNTFAKEFEELGYANRAHYMVLSILFWEAIGRGEDGDKPEEE